MPATDTKRIGKAHTPVSSLVFRSIAGRELNPVKARILLMLALQKPRSPAELQALFDRYGTAVP